MISSRRPRNDSRVIIHFVSQPWRLSLTISKEKETYTRQDYDCFYASVFEHENPALKSLPLVSTAPPRFFSNLSLRCKAYSDKAVQQKQVVTSHFPVERRSKSQVGLDYSYL